MNKSKRLRTTAALVSLVSLAAAFAACGSDDDAAESTSSASVTTEAPDDSEAAPETTADTGSVPTSTDTTASEGTSESADYGAFKFGAVLNLSGPTAEQGQEFLRGLEVAVAEWNETRDGIDGSPIELIVEDHGAQPALAVTAASKLISVDEVPVYANVYSSPVLATLEESDPAGVLQVTAGANSPALVDVSPLLLSSIANAALEADVILAYAAEELDAQRLAIVYGNDDFGLGVRDRAEQVWEDRGLEVVASEGQDPQNADYSALAAKVVAEDPDVVYFAIGGVNIGKAVKAIVEAGFSGAMVGNQGYENPDLFEVAGPLAIGSVWTSSAVAPDSPERANFDERYRAAYGADAEPTLFAQNHYDLANAVLLAAANLKDAGRSWTGSELADAMLALGVVEGVVGPFTLQADGTALRQLDLKTTTDGATSELFLSAEEIQERGFFQFE